MRRLRAKNDRSGQARRDRPNDSVPRALHVVEHIRYTDANHLAYDVTWEDSKMYTKSITNSRVLTRMKPGDELMEYWCMENNRDLPHLQR